MIAFGFTLVEFFAKLVIGMFAFGAIVLRLS